MDAGVPPLGEVTATKAVDAVPPAALETNGLLAVPRSLLTHVGDDEVIAALHTGEAGLSLFLPPPGGLVRLDEAGALVDRPRIGPLGLGDAGRATDA